MEAPTHGPFYLGTSGWAHRDWAGTFYAHDLAPAEYLTHYAQQFDTVEVEHTFFEAPSREIVQSWYRRTPKTFRFSLCAPRQITHVQRLHDTKELLEDFLAVAMELGEKLGPILVQLPHDFRRQEQTSLESFLEALPRRNVQVAIEFHHGSWLHDTTFRLLEAYDVAWVVVDADFLPRVPQVTASFTYVRWHGRPGVGQQARRQLNPVAALRPWVAILRQLERQVSAIYGYIRNSFSGYAPRDGQTLFELLGVKRDSKPDNGGASG